MTTILRFFRSNAVAFLALFIALGGVGWAATSLPAGSVGARQIQNHSITPVKFNRSMIGGSVRYWARISASGKIIASQPKARIVIWYPTPGGLVGGGVVRWGKPIAPACFSLATAESYPQSVSVSAVTVPGNGGLGTQVRLAMPANAIVPVDVAVICPGS